MSAAGKVTAGVVSAKVAALAEGVLRALFLTNLKTVTAMLLVIGMIAFELRLRVGVPKPQATPEVKRRIEELLEALDATQLHSRYGLPARGTMRPSGQAVQRICRAISEMTSRRWSYLPEADIVRMINQRLAGWANYFQLGSVGQAYNAVDRHTTYRLRQWLRWKHKLGRGGHARFSYTYLYQTLGLIRLPLLPRRFPWANA